MLDEVTPGYHPAISAIVPTYDTLSIMHIIRMGCGIVFVDVLVVACRSGHSDTPWNILLSLVESSISGKMNPGMPQ